MNEINDLDIYKKLYIEKKTNNKFLKYSIYLSSSNEILFWFYFIIFNGINICNIFHLISSYTLYYNFIYFIYSFLFSDLISGIVHIYLDNSKIKYNESLIDFYRLGFQIHHKFPLFQLKYFKSYKPYHECNTLFLNAIIISIINIFLFDSLIIHFSLYLLLIMQANHYYCHFDNMKLKIPYLIKILHKYNILVNPQQHILHHTTYDLNFCLINGIMNPILNYLFINKYFDNIIIYIDHIID
jgi:hypothetical protein